MVKLITVAVCPCSICFRSRSRTALPISTSSPLNHEMERDDAEEGGVKRLVGKQDGAAKLFAARSLNTSLETVEPVASTSKIPYIPPASVRLPDELLEIIIGLARPPLPPPSAKRDPLPLSWRSFSRLSLVHSRWHNVAKQELARVVILRTQRQLKALTQAIKDGEVAGKVEEVLLEFKDTASGNQGGPTDEAEPPAGSIVLAASAQAALSTSERDLVELFEACGDKLKVLRLRGFGDPALVSLSPAIRGHLSSLEVFEYSPVDGAHSPTTAGLILGLGSLPKLKELVLHPSNRYLTPLRELPDSIIPSMTRLLDDLPALLSTPALRELYNSAFSDVGLHHLTSLSLHSLALTPLTLLGLLFPSLTTLTSLTLSSTFFVGPAATLFNLLSLLAPQLEEFVWEDKLINPVPTAAPVFLRHLGQSSLPADAYWELLKQLKKVKKLRLFSPHVFSPSPERASFTLPPDLEELSIGSKNEVNSEDLLFWLDQIQALLDSKEPQVEIAEEEEGEGEEEETVIGGIEEEEGQDEEEEEEKDGGEKDQPGDDSGIALTDDEDDSSPSPNLSRSSATSSSSSGVVTPSPALAPISRSLAAEAPIPTSSASPPPPIDRPSSAPPSLSSPSPAKPPSSAPTSPLTLPPPAIAPPSPPSEPKPKRSSPSARKRRLSWRKPPVPPSPPQLRRLTLCTIDTTLRDDAELQDRIEEVVDRGVGVEWYSLMVVVLETLELTRELRVDMLRVPGEEGEGWA